MGRPNADERIARQEHDPGDPDDDVYVKTTGRTRQSFFYHDDPACNTIKRPERYKRVSRAYAQRNWKAPCSVCVLPKPVPAEGSHDHPVPAAFGTRAYAAEQTDEQTDETADTPHHD